MQTVLFKNIGKRTCVFAEHPVLSIGTKNGGSAPVDMTSADSGPWTLQPKKALVYTVTAPRHVVLRADGASSDGKAAIIEQGAFTSTLNFPGMRVFNCGAPVLTDLRVGAPPPD